MSSLGIYFGPNLISLVESKGKKVLNNILISRQAIFAPELEEKVPTEIKLVAFLKEELRKGGIEAKTATLSLSGKDLIVRTFEMPVLPKKELQSAVNFEAKKYIPFKVEDLVSDFQITFDKSTRKNQILFMGIKKETLSSYLSILGQLGIKANAIEYSAFAILRLLRLSGSSDKGIIAVLGVDFKEQDEVNFMVLENGLPLFSRDITLVGESEELAGNVEERESGMTLEKLKTEVRISLDYYHRKFPSKNIKKIFFIVDRAYSSDLETLANEIGLSAQFIDYSKFIDKSVTFSLSFMKAYISSLAKIIKSPLKIDLLSAQIRLKSVKEMAASEEISEAAVSLITGLKIEVRFIVIAILLCLATFIFGLYRKLPVQKELNTIIAMRPQVSTVNPEASFEELTDIDSKYKEKIEALDNLIGKKLFLTEALDSIPRNIPEGLWLIDFAFRKEEARLEQLTLRGIAYQADSDKELKLINIFLTNLKENPQFNKYFKEIDIVSIEHSRVRETSVSNFEISCRSRKERQ